MKTYQAARDLLQIVHPDAVFQSQTAQDWHGTFPLPASLAEYFEQFGPVDVSIPGIGNPYFLPRLSNLWSYQTGYRFDGNTHERLQEWHDDWLVIADEGADPFILSRKSSTVLHAFHGEGVWAPDKAFDSLLEMSLAFAVLANVVSTAGASLTDDDENIRPSVRRDARDRLAEAVGSKGRASAILRELGWA